MSAHRSTPKGSPLEHVTLETSLKPFRSFDDDTLTRTVSEMFRQWQPLLDATRSCSVMLWVADGSEILDWSGDLTVSIEWARFIGFNNTDARAYGGAKAPDRIAQVYTDHPPTLDYGALSRLVRIIKQVGSEDYGLDTTVGATFDPGPEFSPSSFKFERHPEVVARGEDIGIGPIIQMLRHSSLLLGDDREYAAFPHGIPAGTSFGEFLGRQAQDYLTSLGFDYLWLSNGFGFSAFAWTDLGESFDGERFRDEKVEALRGGSLAFWKDFTDHFRLPIEVRGTNHTAGIDIGADAVPALELYEAGYFETPPPNSPWGPLNEDFGIELSGFMSRIAMLPQHAADHGYRYRFYANDPWFWQQPWWDFYNREPFDIYLPLGVSRIDADGKVQTPSRVNILSIDTSHGELDERAGREIGTHIRTALESAPDEAGPIVWVYPFREYHQATTSIGRPHFEDWLLTAAINAGLPVSTVVSTDNLAAAIENDSLRGRTLVVPAGALSDASSTALERHLSAGGSLAAYGSLEGVGPLGKALLGITPEGAAARVELGEDLTLIGDLASDCVSTASMPNTLRHVSDLSDGQVVTSDIADPHTKVIARVRDTQGIELNYATARRHPSWKGGSALWVRGSSPHRYAAPDERGVRAFEVHDRTRFIDPGTILRDAVALTGYAVSHDLRTPSSGRAVLGVHRSRSAFWFSGYLPDTTSRVRLRFPEGSPVLNHQECWLEDGFAHYQFGKSVHAECRVFVEQATPGTVWCREIAPYPAWMSRGMRVSGLVEAAVTFYLPPANIERVRVDIEGTLLSNDDYTIDATSGRCVLHNVTGTLTVAWEEL